MGNTYMWSTPQVYHSPIHYNTASFADAFYTFQMPHYGPIHTFSSGGLVFEDALEKIVVGKRVRESFPEEFRALTSDSSVVTTILHIIPPSFPYLTDPRFKSLRTTLDNSQIKIVPIHVGFNWVRPAYPTLTNAQFPIRPELVTLLKDVSERIDTIACRGEHTAEILNLHGIKNAKPIACPSLFWHQNPDFQITRKADANLRTVNFNLNVNYDYISFIKYFYKLSQRIQVNYISQHLIENLVSEAKQPELIYLARYICDVGHYFLGVTDWVKFIEGTDFTIGARIHGCVASILAGVPALMLTTDNRTEEMCRCMHIPYIDAKEFDDTKPLEYYYELADYSEFNKHFKSNYYAFKDYCVRNGVEINM